VSKEQGENFAAAQWLENDGAPVPQAVAFARTGLIEDGRTVRAVFGDVEVLNLRGATALAAVQGCGGADIIVTNQKFASLSGCEVYDTDRLRQTGALAGWLRDGVLHWVSVRDHTGDRLWNTEDVRRREGPLTPLRTALSH